MIRVIDLTQYVAGPFATMCLAELGADVIKVERPGGGDPWRTQATQGGDGVSFDYLNRHKRSITLNIRSRRGRALLLELVAAADGVIENFRPGELAKLGLSFRAFRRANPRIVLTSISNFGQSGPRRDWEATEFVLEAMGGVMWGTGWDDGPPLQLPGYQACYVAGLNAAAATLAAIYAVRTGSEKKGVHIDLSIQEALALHWTRQVSRYVYQGRPYRREKRGIGRQGFPHTIMAQDGYVYLLAMQAEWEALAYFLGLEQFLGPEWSDPQTRAERWAEIEPHFSAALARRSKYTWFADAAEYGYTFAPVDEPHELLKSPQLLARRYFREAELLSGQRIRCPSLPFRAPGRPTTPNRAPRLGEHNSAVYGEILGLSAADLRELEKAEVI